MKNKWFIALGAFIFFPSFAMAGYFTDVNSTHPHYEAIKTLKELGVIQGYADGTFKPDQKSNRAETLIMLLKAAKIEVGEMKEVQIFPDVPGAAWFANYVAKAQILGIINGYPDGNFYPDRFTNLSEFLKMLLKTNSVEVGEVKKDPYADVPRDRWDAPYINETKWLNLMDQTNTENIYPAHELTRGEMAQFIYRLITGYHQGQASYYGNSFDGVKTSSGQTLSNSDFLAAHKRLPFDSWIKITNLENGKSVNARIIDRGPYTEGRVVDLSQAAFQGLAPLSAGVARVSILPIQDPSTVCQIQEDRIPKALGSSIILDETLPSTYMEGEEINIKGEGSGAEMITGFLLNQAGEQLSWSVPVKEGRFELKLIPPHTGEYKLGLVTGQTGSSPLYPIHVLPDYCLSNQVNDNLSSPGSFSFNHENGDTVLKWERGNYNIFRLVFKQNGLEEVFFTQEPNFIPLYMNFDAFKEGEVEVSLQGGNIGPSETLSGRKIIHWSPPNPLHFQAVLHEPYFLDSKAIQPLHFPESFAPGNSVPLRADPLTDLQQEAWITSPKGELELIKLESSDTGVQTNERQEMFFPASGKELLMNFTPKENGVYFVEWNNSQGIAVVNLPLYPQEKYPLLPNPLDFPQKTADLGEDIKSLNQFFLNLVNQDRLQNGVSPLVLDATLRDLAQSRAEDMVTKDYFSHWNKEGKTANDLRSLFGIKQAVSENLAKENSLFLAQYGLMHSAKHRVNLLAAQWTRVGFGIAKNKEGNYTFVQIFSADPIDLSDLNSLRQKTFDRINSKRTSDFILSEILNTQAQQWSERMVKEDFFGFTAPNADTLVSQLHAQGIQNTLGTYVAGNSSFEAILDQLENNAELRSGNWKALGVGIVQDEFGVIKMTLIYTE